MCVCILFQILFPCCCYSVTKLCLTLLTPWTDARQASLFFIISQNFLKFMSIESVILSNHFILCHPLLLLPSVFPSIRIFFSESSLRIRWPESLSFASVLSVNIQDWFSLELTVLTPCSPGDSQESSPAPQFENINSSATAETMYSAYSQKINKNEHKISNADDQGYLISI